METLYVTRDCQLSRDENTLRIDFPEGGMRRFPVEALHHVVCLNSFTMTSKLLELCGQNGVRVSFFNHYGIFRGAFEPIDKSPSGEVVLRQSQLALDPERRLVLAKSFVMGSGRNANNLIKKVLHNKNASDHEGLVNAVSSLEKLVEQCSLARDIGDLMGREGTWRSLYYAIWPFVDARLDMCGRVRRPPNNPINALVSFLNQMLYANVLHQLAKTHLFSGISFLHAPSRSRASLALDIAEIFRPVFVDRLIFRWVRTGVFKHDWFHCPVPGVCLLSEAGLRQVLELWRAELEEKHGNGTKQDIIHKDCIAIERLVLGLEKAYRPFVMRA